MRSLFFVVLAASLCACESMLAKSDCLEISATGLGQDDVSADAVLVENVDPGNPDCKSIDGVGFATYSDQDGDGNYSSEDILVDTKVAEVASPTDSLLVGSVSLEAVDNGVKATNFQISVSHPDGTTTTFSGTL